MRLKVQRLTAEDLKYCTCGQCRVGDPVRSVSGGYLMEDEPVDPEIFPVVTLAPETELAESARRAPLFDAAVRLAEWCGATPSGRQVTATSVLRRAPAREAVEELQLWELGIGPRDLSDPDVRASVLAGLRSAGDLEVLDAPWQVAIEREFITIRGSRAFRGPELPGPDGMLEAWRDAFAATVDELDDEGAAGIMPGMFGSMLSEYFPSLAFPVLMALYRHPEGEWLDFTDLLSELSPDRGNIKAILAMGTAMRVLAVLKHYGAAEDDGGAEDDDAAEDDGAEDDGEGETDGEAEGSPYRVRLTPLGRYGVRNLLASQGHVVPVAGELATADAPVLLDELTVYDPDSFRAELAGWIAERGEENAVRDILAAVSDADPALAVRRFAAVTVLTLARPSDRARDILRKTAADGADGCRHVAAGVLANLGEEPPSYRERIQPWLVIDSLSVLAGAESHQGLPPDLVAALRGNADDLWRCDHPATASTLEAVGDAIRDSDKSLAKQLRRAAHKARARG